MNKDIIESEIKFLRNIDAIMQLAVAEIDRYSNGFLYLDQDEDLDNEPFRALDVEFNYLDLRVWIDFNLYNDSYDITNVCVKNNDDIDYLYVTKWLEEELVRYYHRESTQRSYSYKQALAINQEQKDPYNLRPNKRLDFEVNEKHFKALQSICEEKDENISLFLETGFAFKLKLKKGVSIVKLVKEISPIIKDDVFKQVNKTSTQTKIACFIQTNFKEYNDKPIPLQTLKNNLSYHFWAG